MTNAPRRPGAQGSGPVPKNGKVEQQWLGAHLLVHYAIRALINAAAEAEELDPDRVSFMRSIRVIRRRVTNQAAFSP